MKNNDEQIVNCLMMWIVFLGILFGACVLGLLGSLLEVLFKFI
jgi:hypothetical protein